jgi:hypothetical protein
MPPFTPELSLLDSLITLKSRYERSLSEAETKASHLREQLSHVNALLLNQFVPTKAPIKSAESALTLDETEAQVERLSLAPGSDTPKPKATTGNTKAESEVAPASGKRSPRTLLPTYEGVTRLEAIAQLLQTTPGQNVTADQVSKGLFGTLSAADHKAERKSLNTQLYKGQSLKLWQKGTAPGTFTIGAPTPKPPATTTTKRKSLTLLPAYAELTKREAIAQVLQQYLGEVLHQDTIIQMLYGDLGLEDLKDERVRIKTALLTGVKDKKWQKAFEPSSYFIKATAGSAKTKIPGRKSKVQTTEAETAIATIETKPAAAAKQRNSLTVLPAFEGMTKLDAIAAVLGQNLGEALHQNTIIQMLYGDLSLEDLKKERVRMDTCLRNGVKNSKWKKAPVAASYVLEAKAAGAKPRSPGRKPDPSKEPQPQPVAEVVEAKATHQEYAPATEATAAKPKSGQKSAIAKAKTSQKKVRPKHSELELVALLKKADIQV